MSFAVDNLYHVTISLTSGQTTNTAAIGSSVVRSRSFIFVAGNECDDDFGTAKESYFCRVGWDGAGSNPTNIRATKPVSGSANTIRCVVVELASGIGQVIEFESTIAEFAEEATSETISITTADSFLVGSSSWGGGLGEFGDLADASWRPNLTATTVRPRRGTSAQLGAVDVIGFIVEDTDIDCVRHTIAASTTGTVDETHSIPGGALNTTERWMICHTEYQANNTVYIGRESATSTRTRFSASTYDEVHLFTYTGNTSTEHEIQHVAISGTAGDLVSETWQAADNQTASYSQAPNGTFDSLLTFVASVQMRGFLTSGSAWPSYYFDTVGGDAEAVLESSTNVEASWQFVELPAAAGGGAVDVAATDASTSAESVDATASRSGDATSAAVSGESAPASATRPITVTDAAATADTSAASVGRGVAVTSGSATAESGGVARQAGAACSSASASGDSVGAVAARAVAASDAASSSEQASASVAIAIQSTAASVTSESIAAARTVAVSTTDTSTSGESADTIVQGVVTVSATDASLSGESAGAETSRPLVATASSGSAESAAAGTLRALAATDSSATGESGSAVVARGSASTGAAVSGESTGTTAQRAASATDGSVTGESADTQLAGTVTVAATSGATSADSASTSATRPSAATDASAGAESASVIRLVPSSSSSSSSSTSTSSASPTTLRGASTTSTSFAAAAAAVIVLRASLATSPAVSSESADTTVEGPSLVDVASTDAATSDEAAAAGVVRVAAATSSATSSESADTSTELANRFITLSGAYSPTNTLRAHSPRFTVKAM